MMGEAAPYSLINDNLIMSLFLLNILSIGYVFLMNGSSLLEQAKNLLYYSKKTTPYNDRTHITRICNILLYWQTLFYSSITIFGYMQYNKPDGMNYTMAYSHLICYFLLFTVALTLKVAISYLCNSTLFGKQAAQDWNQSFFFTIKTLGFILFPIVVCCLLVKGFPKSYYTIYMIFATIFYLFAIITGSIKIIFAKKRNYLDIFLYLCALELLPMTVLWRIIHESTIFLIIKF